jgi:NAD(P)H-hydrate repair Nnr-like enzyme with NAD(P)H-hydrate epimerase domain
MIRAYAVSSVREAEAAAMSMLDEGELMSRAAAGLAAVASARLVDRSGTGGLHGRCVVALVGAGNNGGDALFASALLACEGAAVVVLTVAETVHEGGLLAARDAGVVVLNAVGAHAD